MSDKHTSKAPSGWRASDWTDEQWMAWLRANRPHCPACGEPMTAGQIGGHIEHVGMAKAFPNHRVQCTSVKVKHHEYTRWNPERTAKKSTHRCYLDMGHELPHRAPPSAHQAPWWD